MPGLSPTRSPIPPWNAGSPIREIRTSPQGRRKRTRKDVETSRRPPSGLGKFSPPVFPVTTTEEEVSRLRQYIISLQEPPKSMMSPHSPCSSPTESPRCRARATKRYTKPRSYLVKAVQFAENSRRRTSDVLFKDPPGSFSSKSPNGPPRLSPQRRRSRRLSDVGSPMSPMSHYMDSTESSERRKVCVDADKTRFHRAGPELVDWLGDRLLKKKTGPMRAAKKKAKAKPAQNKKLEVRRQQTPKLELPPRTGKKTRKDPLMRYLRELSDFQQWLAGSMSTLRGDLDNLKVATKGREEHSWTRDDSLRCNHSGGGGDSKEMPSPRRAGDEGAIATARDEGGEADDTIVNSYESRQGEAEPRSSREDCSPSIREGSRRSEFSKLKRINEIENLKQDNTKCKHLWYALFIVLALALVLFYFAFPVGGKKKR